MAAGWPSIHLATSIVSTAATIMGRAPGEWVEPLAGYKMGKQFIPELWTTEHQAKRGSATATKRAIDDAALSDSQ